MQITMISILHIQYTILHGYTLYSKVIYEICMQNMLTNNPHYIGDAIIVMFGFSVLICHPPNLLDKFGEKIWRELEKMR